MPTPPIRRRSRPLWILVVAVLIGGFATAASALTGEPPAVVCDAESLTWGEPLTCTATGDDVTGMAWPDGATSGMGPLTYAPQSVGDVEVNAIDLSGTVLAVATVTIAPDLHIDCSEGDEKIVYELASTDLRPEGWDYVYIDPSTDERVQPGDPTHPGQAPYAPLERIELDRVNATGFCRLESAAGEALDGSWSLSLESEWEPTMRTEHRIIGPASKTKWAGAQPGTLTGTVTIGSVTASERVGVYLAGCA